MRAIFQSVQQAFRPRPTPRRMAGTCLLQAALFASGCGKAVLTADDTILRADGTATLTAYVEREPMLGVRHSVQGITVRFLIGECDAGRAVTDHDGRAQVVAPVEAQRVTPFQVEVEIEGRQLRAQAAVHMFDTDRTIIVVDIDHTIADTEYMELLLNHRDHESDPMPRSLTVMTSLAQSFQFVYLTGRPRFLTEKTRHWLTDQKYPAGPLFVAAGLRRAIEPFEYKHATLSNLRRDWPNMLIGIGDTSADARAYNKCGMLSITISDGDEDEDEDEEQDHPRKSRTVSGAKVLELRNWTAIERFFADHRSLLTSPRKLDQILRSGERFLRPIQTRQED